MLEVVWDSVVDDRHGELLFGPFHRVVPPPPNKPARDILAKDPQGTLIKTLRNGPGSFRELIERSGLGWVRANNALYALQQKGIVVARGQRRYLVYHLAEI